MIHKVDENLGFGWTGFWFFRMIYAWRNTAADNKLKIFAQRKLLVCVCIMGPGHPESFPITWDVNFKMGVRRRAWGPYFLNVFPTGFSTVATFWRRRACILIGEWLRALCQPLPPLKAPDQSGITVSVSNFRGPKSRNPAAIPFHSILGLDSLLDSSVVSSPATIPSYIPS